MKNYIDGKWVESSTGSTLTKLNPSNGKVLYKFPAASKEDASRAIDSAEDALENWKGIGSRERSAILLKAADLISSERKELEDILISENGKIPVQASEEVDGVIDQIRYYAGFERKITGDVVEGEGRLRKIFQYKEPYGVVLALTPWNFPAAMVARKLAPALLAGNTVVLKPSSDTPGSAEWIVRKFVRAGVPRGVLNFITGKGSEIGDFLTSHSKVALITMTGSTSTGQRIMEKASANMAKLVLELGGKAPFMVWKDADLKSAARALIWAKFWNAGQSCIASERLYIHEDVYEKFMKIFLEAVRKMKVGDPMKSDIGPLINADALSTVEKFVKTGMNSGAKLVYGGKRPKLTGDLRNGFFFEPTVMENVKQKSLLFQDEIFGPIIGAKPVSDFNEMIREANDSKYGLASYLYTRDYETFLKAADGIRFGELYVNMTGPEASQGYHTGFRMTGQAGEGSRYGIEEYVKLRNVYVDYSGEVKLKSFRTSL